MMTRLKTTFPRTLRVLLTLALVFAAVFASVTLDAGDDGCCGVFDKYGYCVLDGNYDPCQNNGDCGGNFPVCCETGGWCG